MTQPRFPSFNDFMQDNKFHRLIDVIRMEGFPGFEAIDRVKVADCYISEGARFAGKDFHSFIALQLDGVMDNRSTLYLNMDLIVERSRVHKYCLIASSREVTRDNPYGEEYQLFLRHSPFSVRHTDFFA